MTSQENPRAGQGAVVLDIGGDVGALIVEMPAHLEHLEVEIIPTGTDRRAEGGVDALADHHHHHDDDHGAPGHSHSQAAPPHVAIVARPTPMGTTIYSLVYEIVQGTYDLYLRPFGPIRLTASVTGGEITQARWPDWHPA